MAIVLLILAVIYLAGLLIVAGAASRAPEGFEDDEGFHTGRGHLPDQPGR